MANAILVGSRQLVDESLAICNQQLVAARCDVLTVYHVDQKVPHHGGSAEGMRIQVCVCGVVHMLHDHTRVGEEGGA